MAEENGIQKDSEHRHTNRLINETSPYLLQHAHNPVDWYPWGEEALRKARQEDKPILLSIGYSACHWCHVMEHESFENEEIARLMNEHFVNIKVDREERPDLDSIYMDAVQAMTGQGGWPMTVFLMPDGTPFYGGTYFPPAPRHGLPGFPQVLLGVAEAYGERRDEVARAAQLLIDRLQSLQRFSADESPLADGLLEEAFRRLRANYDPRDGGFGPAPKFPQSMNLQFLLHYWHRTQQHPLALQMVEHTLERMARGGIYDHIGGGFHRYAVDAHWLVPHFEKMLYDNALLARVYLEAYQITGKASYRQVVTETLDYVLREMRDGAGGFYSAQDADSEGEEGKFFVWTPDEIGAVLGDKQEADIVMNYFGVTERGNFGGKNILHRPRDHDVVAYQAGISDDELTVVTTRSRQKLFEARERRVHPATDTKVLTNWNGLMIVALAEAGAVLRRDDYRRAAVDAAEFIWSMLRRTDGRLLHSYREGRARQLGFLEDYAFFADALLALYETTFDLRWLEMAIELTDAMIELFWDEEKGGFFLTGSDQEALVTRPKDLPESAMPSGNAVAAHVLLRLALLTARPHYQRRAVVTLRLARDFMAEHPSAMGRMLVALDFYLSVPSEIAIVGELASEGTQRLLDVVYGRFLPNKVLALRRPDQNGMLDELIPLLEDKTMLDGQPTAYVCQDYACRAPVTEPEALAEQLERM